jgi:outer membrane protein assembly factor BamB
VKLARRAPRIPGLIVLVVLLSALTALASPQAPHVAPAGSPPRPEDPKKAALRAPALSMVVSWTATLPAPPSAGVGIDAVNAYVPLRTSELVALALKDGTVAWSAPIAEIVSPPVTGDGLVFLAHARQVEALDAATGAPRWRVAIDGAVSAPLLWQNGWLLAVGDSGAATMLRATTGEVLWKQALGSAVRVLPAAADRHVYVATEDARVVALALESGKPVWEAKLPARGTTLYPLDDRIFVGSADKFFYCLAADTGRTKWRWRTGGAVVGTTAVDAGRVYFVSLDNVLRALDRSNGGQVWKAALPNRPTGGPYLTARLLLVPGISADLPAFQAFDGTAAGTTRLAGDPVAPPRLLPGEGKALGRLVTVTGEGQAQLLVPGLPILPGKPIPGLPMFTLPPEAKGETAPPVLP